MNLKIGQILKYKDSNEVRQILDVYGNSALLTKNTSFQNQVLTFEEMKNIFEIPEEEWELSYGDLYWYIGSDTQTRTCSW